MPNILHINVVANSGSTGRIAENIAILAKEEHFDSYMAYGRWANQSQFPLYKIGGNLDKFYHVYKTRVLDRHGFGSRGATKKLISYIQETNPDLIHLHNIHGYYLNIEVLFTYLSTVDIPIVWTLHDCWSMTGHCVHFQNVGCEKWKKGCSHCPNLHDYPSSLYYDNSSNNYERKKELFNAVKNLTIVPVCNWLSSVVQESFLQEHKKRVIINGIDLDVFSPKTDSYNIREKLKIGSKFMILAVASNWNITKGEKDLYELSKELLTDDVLVMIGLTRQQITNLPANIVGIEKIENQEELAAFYRVADVVVNPTYQDTFPTINLEALACATPVVTYNTGGCRDALTNETGIIVERGNQAKLLEAVLTVKKQQKNFYSQHCRKHAELTFDKNERFRDYIQLYNQLLSK